jgi:hypothetical protein
MIYACVLWVSLDKNLNKNLLLLLLQLTAYILICLIVFMIVVNKHDHFTDTEYEVAWNL